MPKKTLPYNEGDWFAVPLDNMSYAIGRIARIGRRGRVVLGFFFGPRLFEMPTPESVVGLHRSSAILIKQFCDPGLLDGSWPIIAIGPDMDRMEYAQTRFGYMADPSSPYARCREYSDDDPFEIVSDTSIDPAIAKQLPKDGLSGHIGLQNRLNLMLE